MKAATSLLLFSVLGLLVLGIVMLVSASTGQQEARYLIMQPIWAGVGLVGLLVAASGDYRWIKKFWWALLALAVVLLALVWMPHVGIMKNGARRWIGFESFRLQPSEFAKIALIISIAWYGERFQRHMGTFTRGVLIPGVGIGSVLFLIFKEPDVGTTLLLAGVSSVMLLVAGLRWRYVLPPLVAGLIGITAFIAQDSVRSQRIHAWLHPEETRLDKGMQTYQAMAALGSGGLKGVGLGEGRQKLGFVPEHHTDFILSVVGEELGLAATLSVILAFMVILFCGIYIAWNAADTFGMLIATGITFLIAMQVVINIGVVTGSLPNKGLALPFISYGGSNLVIMMGCIGLLINIGRHATCNLTSRSGVMDMDELAAPENA
ncbi:MAG: putative lipid II flippase FtsW [Verrucomicrobia bacterium]|nr:putative lipid II flippase FtsW [Verrucomicrobiota bacterium]